MLKIASFLSNSFESGEVARNLSRPSDFVFRVCVLNLCEVSRTRLATWPQRTTKEKQMKQYRLCVCVKTGSDIACFGSGVVFKFCSPLGNMARGIKGWNRTNIYRWIVCRRRRDTTGDFIPAIVQRGNKPNCDLKTSVLKE